MRNDLQQDPISHAIEKTMSRLTGKKMALLLLFSSVLRVAVQYTEGILN